MSATHGLSQNNFCEVIRMKNLVSKINSTTTFSVAHEIATDLHFSLANIAILYGVFTLGIFAIIPGAERFTDPAQIALGRFAYAIGKKED